MSSWLSAVPPYLDDALGMTSLTIIPDMFNLQSDKSRHSCKMIDREWIHVRKEFSELLRGLPDSDADGRLIGSWPWLEAIRMFLPPGFRDNNSTEFW